MEPKQKILCLQGVSVKETPNRRIFLFSIWNSMDNFLRKLWSMVHGNLSLQAEKDLPYLSPLFFVDDLILFGKAS